MEEKILISGKAKQAFRVLILFVLIGAIIVAGIAAFLIMLDAEYYYGTGVHTHSEYCYAPEYAGEYFIDLHSPDGVQISKMDCIQANYGNDIAYGIDHLQYHSESPILYVIGIHVMINIFVFPIVFFALLGIAAFLAFRICEITVTDQRIYGTRSFGRKIEWPLDSVRTVSTGSLLKSVRVHRLGEKATFWGISNNKEICSVLNQLIQEKKQEKTASEAENFEKLNVVLKNTANQSVQTDSADQLMKYKKLLDDGAITQEEYDTLKKQILGL